MRKVSAPHKIAQDLLSLAGEYRVCSELNKRGVFATVTYGNRKSVDIYAISDRYARALRIEVKTSQTRWFVTRIFNKAKNQPENLIAPDYWVLVQVRRDGNECYAERFFVLTHREICRKPKVANDEYMRRYKKRHHGKKFDISKGVDRVAEVEEYEGAWSKICDDKRLRGRNP